MRKRSERGEVQKREFFGGLVMTYDGVKLLRPRAIEDIWVDFTKDYVAKKKAVWLKEFQTFEDKASAINIDTGVNEQLAKMIQKHIEPDLKLSV